jgi:hypothetical protein
MTGISWQDFVFGYAAAIGLMWLVMALVIRSGK